MRLPSTVRAADDPVYVWLAQDVAGDWRPSPLGSLRPPAARTRQVRVPRATAARWLAAVDAWDAAQAEMLHAPEVTTPPATPAEPTPKETP